MKISVWIFDFRIEEMTIQINLDWIKFFKFEFGLIGLDILDF